MDTCSSKWCLIPSKGQGVTCAPLSTEGGFSYAQSTGLWPQSQNCTANGPSSNGCYDTRSVVSSFAHIEAASSSSADLETVGEVTNKMSPPPLSPFSKNSPSRSPQ
uniref:Uncharacterized protein n=1 Tax=Eutreptiella gymnastica TaxID=73025 RepID=A0A7S1N1A8_9EUGL|mmetsp:Transcript_104491/g.180052  ORF Transcript_104491/g.180052 Transcript_104491/m.180052 type:complete len:106 (+) Transcript_104491:451-768(+)